MDRQQQAARIERIVDTIAERSLDVPPEIRAAFIQEEVVRVREAFRETYEADPRLRACAMDLVDSMTGSVEARIHALETEASGTAEVEEDGAEPKT